MNIQKVQEMAEKDGLTILSQSPDLEGYYVGVKQHRYADDEWELYVMFNDSGEWRHAVAIRNNRFHLTTAQIMALPPVADLLAVCNVMAETLAHLQRNDPHLAENVVIPPQLEAAQAVISGARGIDETM